MLAVKVPSLLCKRNGSGKRKEETKELELYYSKYPGVARKARADTINKGHAFP
jgi:hypothetical protein